MNRNALRLVAVLIAGIALLNAVWLLKSGQAETLIAVPALAENPKAREEALIHNIKLLNRVGWVRARGHAEHYRALADLRHAAGDHRAEAQLRITALQVGPSSLDDRLSAAQALSEIGDALSRDMAAALLQDAAYFSTFATAGRINEVAERLNLPTTYGRDAQPALNGEVLVLTLGDVDGGIVDRVAHKVGEAFGVPARIEAHTEFNFGPPDREHAGHAQYKSSRLMRKISDRLGTRFADNAFAAVLVLTARDLYDPDLNFIWAKGGDGYSIISTVRLAGADPGITADRVAKQAITSTLDWLGIPRASHPQCANANAISVAEMDQKTTRLCAETRVQLEARFSQKQGAVQTR